jgi:hypothetical protein
MKSAISRLPATGILLAQLRARWRAMRSSARAWLAGKLQFAALYELGHGFWNYFAGFRLRG